MGIKKLDIVSKSKFVNKIKELKVDISDDELSHFSPEVAQLADVTSRSHHLTTLSAEISHKKRLNEAKLLLIGQGSVGKTSLVKRLIEGSYDRYEAKTEGINIRSWGLRINNETIRLNIWDFGGQEIIQATHQFFLTKRGLYLLVLDARRGAQESGLEYWLKIIESFAGDSPIIVVINKIDQHRLQINRSGLQYKYPNIKGFVNTSCATGEGIDRLKALISRQIRQLVYVDDLLPESWFTIKDKLKQMEADYLSYNEYQRLCREQGIHETQEQRVLIQLLHDLGIVLNFQDDPRLKSTNVLNPEWLTHGVHKILNAHILADNNGILERHQLNDILDSVRYPPDKQLFIVDMMRKFELCYELEAPPNQKFLIPDLLPKQQPDLSSWNREASLAFQYRYDVLPSSIMSRFIVRMQRYVLPKKTWHNGVVLNNEETNNQALLIADIEDKKISVWVTGTEATRRAFLTIIRDHFDDIHASIPKIKVKQVVSLPNQPDVTIDYEDLRQLQKRGVRRYYLPKADGEIEVKWLLDKIEPPKRRKKKDARVAGDEQEQNIIRKLPDVYILTLYLKYFLYYFMIITSSQILIAFVGVIFGVL